MNIKITKILFILFFFTLLSCNNNLNRVDEGVLIYKITYLQKESENSLISLLPRTVKIKFKKNNTSTIVEGFFGAFQLKFINIPKEKQSYTVLRVMDKKFYSENEANSVYGGYSDLKITEIQKIPNDTLRFAGLLSHKALVFCKEMSDSAITIYYTNDLKIKNPNSNTPYNELNSVLTKFQTKVAGIDMVFELIELNIESVSDNEFIVPKNSKKISKKNLNSILQSFQE